MTESDYWLAFRLRFQLDYWRRRALASEKQLADLIRDRIERTRR